MDRSELKQKFDILVAEAKVTVEKSPLKAVAVAGVFGFLLAIFWHLLFSFLFVSALIAAAIWFLAEESSSKANEDAPESEKSLNGSAERANP